MINEILSVLFHLESHISAWATFMGPWLYVVLFLVIFAETGLIVTPFLPGDSLLFSLGSICAIRPDILDIRVLAPLLIVAAILGDAINFSMGHFLRVRMLKGEGWRFLNQKHLSRAEDFYKRYGGKAIFLARFLPIVRTYAPFVAGVSLMSRSRFTYFNVVGVFAWILLFLAAGYFFGETEVVKQNFTLVILAIIVVSLLPVFYELFKKMNPSLNLKNGG